MMRDYAVYYKGALIGVFRDYSEEGARKQAWQKSGYSASKYSSCLKSEYIVMKLGLL